MVAGKISDAVTLNRYAYANGNPVSNVDPFGLSAERGNWGNSPSPELVAEVEKTLQQFTYAKTTAEYVINEDMRKAAYKWLRNSILKTKRPNNIGKGIWAKQIQADLDWADDLLGPSSKLAKGLKVAPFIGVALDTGLGIYENIQYGVDAQRIVSDAIVDTGTGVGVVAASTAVGTALGSIIPIPVVGNLVGAGAGAIAGSFINWLIEGDFIAGQSAVDWMKDGADWVADRVVDVGNAISDGLDAVGDWFSGLFD